MRKLAIALVIAFVPLTACSEDDADEVAAAASPVSSAAAAAASDLQSAAAQVQSAATSAVAAAASSVESAAESVAAAPVDGAATCEFLRTKLPEWKAVGSSVGALARFAGDYFAFVSAQPGGRVASAAELDEITKRDCPDVRTEVLALLDAEDFAGTL